jgi:hypothetical protein
MRTGRYNHIAVSLNDGKVLLAGGDNSVLLVSGHPLSSAEIYDPSLNTWSPIAPMRTARHFHVATLLKDGRVLVIGGTNVDDVVGRPSAGNTAEIYDPRAGTWTQTENLNWPRSQGHIASLLSDGRVIVFGGDSLFGDIFDPSTLKWTPTAPLTTARTSATSTGLASGQVLVAGGYQNSGSTLVALPTTEIYTTPESANAVTNAAPTISQIDPSTAVVGAGVTSVLLKLIFCQVLSLRSV